MTNKPQLRERYLKVRSMLSQKYLEECNKKITRKVIFFIEHYKLKRIGIFLSSKNEPETREIIKWCFNNQIEVYVPRCLTGILEMNFRLIKNFDTDIEYNPEYKIYDGSANTPILKNSNDLDALFMPLVTYDNKLARIGNGKSFYDIWIEKMNYQGYKIGLSQSTQLTNTPIITEEHDFNMNFVITEKEVNVAMVEEAEEEFDYDVTLWRFNDETIDN
ncbi:5-formyltetrahydrofolate cyclo-ligase [Mesoplasma syrphidae]|uniref:5-formyltetrahydrofolate cyclo-ligase n=1 Tax=Mesoplasma syrphidae TaxID=225999 RepID=A0A2K9BN14_9MOLU|nr:5-formyltetrahydrofolate cyclo-ligase [Mesoplasma syrphidae]AUF83433.1 5-formyltetrahydrofolate cyclo-ligase [Mesoplasma syrphidae]